MEETEMAGITNSGLPTCFPQHYPPEVVSDSMVTISFFTFSGFSDIRWALAQMRRAHEGFNKAGGPSFYKLMGTGGGDGLSIWPDWSTFCLLGVWKDESEWRNALSEIPYLTQATQRSQYSHVQLAPLGGHGTWGGVDPFKGMEAGIDPHSPIAVLTRASIRRSKWWSFWKEVPTVAGIMKRQKGNLFFKGIGELPLVEQATFSVWKDIESIRSFAYEGTEHKEVIRKTRIKEWYSEELFYRFKVLSVEGNSPRGSSWFSY
ncbi:MAG: DUF3291 domain-containing protein [Bacteroidota bacterium]|nr:DUF3291 domain-containing protein [Bacteroidota bacterium]MDX5426682.1 DUF3291 domain-containing protein [Bacteroidota bacterium]MDX5448652.1 DUF3291 domain-containing protein [Bacteroidota bacterium]